MQTVDATKPEDIERLPDSSEVIVILEGISMYLTNDELKIFLSALQTKYHTTHLLMDIYTEFAAKATRYKNPINEVGVTKVYGIADIKHIVDNTGDLNPEN